MRIKKTRASAQWGTDTPGQRHFLMYKKKLHAKVQRKMLTPDRRTDGQTNRKTKTIFRGYKFFKITPKNYI